MHLILKYINRLVMLAILGLLITQNVSAQNSNAPTSTTLSFPELAAPVSVRRDARGVPFIEAGNDNDLYFAQGYVTASDRLWQMDLLRRTARGELAEIFGKTVLEEDKRRRTFGYARVAEAATDRMEPQSRRVYESYAAGVNAFIASLDAKTLPAEFQILQYRPRPWTVADSILGNHLFAEALSMTYPTDLMRLALANLPAERRKALLPNSSPLDVLVVGTDEPSSLNQKSVKIKLPDTTVQEGGMKEIANSLSDDARRAFSDALLSDETLAQSLNRIGLGAEDRAASNNWVVSGKRTASGKPLLADDPHLRPSAPSIWYMTHLSSPGLRVSGVTSPGLPHIIIGHNERIAWGVTNLLPDVQDLYAEQFDPANPQRYMTPAGWRDAEVRSEIIKVRQGLTTSATDDIKHEVIVTRHGPIIIERGGKRYALRWTALDPDLVRFDPFYLINRASNWKEFTAGLRDFTGPGQNFVFADTRGNIGYYGAGRIPLRRTGDGSLPYDGATDAGEWTGFIPFDELPHILNPASGIIVTANSRVVGASYKHHLTHAWSPPYRTRRIYDLLTEKNKLTIEDFRRIQGDVTSPAAVIFRKEFLRIAKKSGAQTNPANNRKGTDNTNSAMTANTVSSGNTDESQWLETLRLIEAWDGSMASDSRAALLASEMRNAFNNRILASALGTEGARTFRWASIGTFLDRIIAQESVEWLPKEFTTYEELLRACHSDARIAIAKLLGPDPAQWTWGRSAQARFPHPLASAPLIGARFAIEPFPQEGSGLPFSTPHVGALVSLRFIADTSNWDASRLGIALGQSGDPGNPHWSDQLADWKVVKPASFPFTKKGVKEATKNVLTLTPLEKGIRQL
jgi:penicillin amidase